jgi:hypothetical protein
MPVHIRSIIILIDIIVDFYHHIGIRISYSAKNRDIKSVSDILAEQCRSTLISELVLDINFLW